MNTYMNTKRITMSLCLCALMLAGGMLATLRPVRADGGRGYIPGEIVVKLFNATDIAGCDGRFRVEPNTAETVWQPANLRAAHRGR